MLKDLILTADKLDESRDDRVLFHLAKLLKEIKEGPEGAIHSVMSLK